MSHSLDSRAIKMVWEQEMLVLASLLISSECWKYIWIITLEAWLKAGALHGMQALMLNYKCSLPGLIKKEKLSSTNYIVIFLLYKTPVELQCNYFLNCTLTVICTVTG